jgi:hypothetical protein
MPSQRSRSQERDKKRRLREKRSAEALTKDQEKARNEMAKVRENRKEGDERTGRDTIKKLGGDVLYCETETYERRNEQSKSGMRKIREKQTERDRLLVKNRDQERKRENREGQCEKERQEENEKAKMRMRNLRLMRSRQKCKEDQMKKREVKVMPDIVEKINKMSRIEKDQKIIEKSKQHGLEDESKITVRNMVEKVLKNYKKIKYQERKVKFKERTMFEGITQKYKYRDLKLKSAKDESEAEMIKKKNQDDKFQDLYKFYQINEVARNILKEESNDLYSKFKTSEEDKIKEKSDSKNKQDSLAKENETESCTCDYDVTCEYCGKIFEDENDLNMLAEDNWTKEEEREFEEKEIMEYRRMKRLERNKKRRVKAEEAKKPLPPLPARELCLYEKIREEIIAERNVEWEKYQKDLEKKEKDEKLKKKV